jgi:glycosyltransferase involved in cell wall biosynthesis
MLFTVTIQTYNRADALARALQSLGQLRCPHDAEYEILAIDNGSTDRTPAVLEEYQAVLGTRFRRIVEPRQGLSHARNRAIEEAHGDVICFMDDDAVADGDWLAGHAAVYRTDAAVAAAGGRITLRWPQGQSRPPWLAGDLDVYLGGLDLGTQPVVMQYPCYPYGCNMSVRRRVAQEIGGFCIRLGRTDADLLSNEEKFFFLRLHQERQRVVYAPGAVVHHVIPAERLSKRFLLRRAYAQGVSEIMLRREISPGHEALDSKVRMFLGGVRRLVMVCLRTLATMVRSTDKATRFLSLTRSAYAVGYVAGMAGWTA